MLMLRRYIYWLALLPCAVLLCGCDLLDCTGTSSVKLRFQFYDSSGNTCYLPDSLTVTAAGTDSILLNRKMMAYEVELPMSYMMDADTFLLRHSGEDYVETDSLIVKKDNYQYFESPDCPTRVMHTINDAYCSDEWIDSVRIVERKVGFEDVIHLRIYIRD
jgi:hypothetical protein